MEKEKVQIEEGLSQLIKNNEIIYSLLENYLFALIIQKNLRKMN